MFFEKTIQAFFCLLYKGIFSYISDGEKLGFIKHTNFLGKWKRPIFRIRVRWGKDFYIRPSHEKTIPVRFIMPLCDYTIFCININGICHGQTRI